MDFKATNIHNTQKLISLLISTSKHVYSGAIYCIDPLIHSYFPPLETGTLKSQIHFLVSERFIGLCRKNLNTHTLILIV